MKNNVRCEQAHHEGPWTHLTAPHSSSSKLISSNFAGIFGAVCVCCQAINYKEGKEGRYCVFFSQRERGRGEDSGRADAAPSLILHLLFFAKHTAGPTSKHFTIARQRQGGNVDLLVLRLLFCPVRALTFILKSALWDPKHNPTGSSLCVRLL